MSPRRRHGKPPLIEGRDYYCGTCAGHRLVPCQYCYEGCPECKGRGEVKCPECKAGEVPVPPPVDL